MPPASPSLRFPSDRILDCSNVFAGVDIPSLDVRVIARRDAESSTLPRRHVDRECFDDVIVFESGSFVELYDVVDPGGSDDEDVRLLFDEREGSSPVKGHAFLVELTDRLPNARGERGSGALVEPRNVALD